MCGLDFNNLKSVKNPIAAIRKATLGERMLNRVLIKYFGRK